AGRVWLGIDGIVEVASVLAVDRDERQLPQILPPLRLTRIHTIAPRLSFAQCLGRKLMRQIEARNGGFRRELDRAVRIEPLFDPRLCSFCRTTMSRDARDDPLAVSRPVERLVRDGASKLQAAIGSRDPCGPAQYLDRTEECTDAMLDDLFDGPRPAVTGIARDSNTQPVPVHHTAHFRRRQEDTVFHPLDA